MSSDGQAEHAGVAPEIASTLAHRRCGLLGFPREETDHIAKVLERVHAAWTRFDESWIAKSAYLGDVLLVKLGAVKPEVFRTAATSKVPLLIVGPGEALLAGSLGAYVGPGEILAEPWPDAELLLRLFRLLAQGRPEMPKVEPRAQPLVLIADDDFASNALVETTLRTHGIACRSVTDGLRALRLARQIRPDLLVLDVQMPGMSGFEVLEAIRQDFLLERTPVALLTSCVEEGEVSRGSELRADDYVAKPVGPTALFNRIRRLLSASVCVPAFCSTAEDESEAGPADSLASEETEQPPGFEELRALYLSNRTRELVSLANAVERGDFDVLARAGHNLKGTGAAYGFAELSEIGKALEDAAKALDAPQIEVQLGKAESYLNHLNQVPSH